MNALGKLGRPFVFVIDFEMKKVIVSEPAHLDNSIHISFPNFIHNTHSDRLSDRLKWSKNPMSFEDYEQGYNKVMHEINVGNTFLINLTYPTEVDCSGGIHDIFHSATAKYKMYLESEFTFFSPETFVKITDGRIATYPMKGTIDASLPNALETLLADEKELAEHYTIVDLLRNDLSIVAKQVNVTKFRYPDYLQTNDKSLIQISSEIEGKLPEDYASAIGDLLFALLPAGSISGAPKKKTVEIIKSAEQLDRGYYTGIAGYFDGRDLDSTVMIRYIEEAEGRLQYRSGCGITSQSDLRKEYEEMIDKVYLPTTKPAHKAEQDVH